MATGRNAQHEENPQNQHLQWEEAGSTAQDLQNLMRHLYWIGVERDIVDIIHTLRTWRGEEYHNVQLKEDPLCAGRDPRAPFGFGTFIKRSTTMKKDSKDFKLQHTIKTTLTQAAVRGSYPRFERMAHILLQGAGFLDIDKLIEYRPPLEEYSIWTRPRAPQLIPDNKPNTNQRPSFQPMKCNSCSTVIRGCHFRCVSGCTSLLNEQNKTIDENIDGSWAPDVVDRSYFICETCTRNNAHPYSHLRKCQKQCIVKESISLHESHQMCECRSLRLPQKWQPFPQNSLFPFHCSQRGLHRYRCELLRIMPEHIKARYADIPRYRNQWLQMAMGMKASETPPAISSDNQTRNDYHQENFVSTGDPISGNNQGGTSKLLVKGILKPIIRPILEKIPFGNVHMALQFGPLIIENGVPDSNSGVRISLRDPMSLVSTSVKRPDVQHEMFSLSPERTLYHAYAEARPRRLKACMKQVVGGAFCEIHDVLMEHNIIQVLAQESEKCKYEPLKTQKYDDEKLRKAASRIVNMLRTLLEDNVSRYLEALVGKLFHPQVELKWDLRSNHCQRFCEAILDYEIFGNFIQMEAGCRECIPSNPLYLVSFVCQSGSYEGLPTKVRPKSKKVAPNGLTEEYLFRFYKYGHHDDSDILDTLMEYWYDWGAFGGTIFEHQQIFPWDCTEACKMGEENNEFSVKCNRCSIIQHVWAFPFDSWSLVQLHMTRDRRFYAPESNASRTLSDIEWMQNRLHVLNGLQALNAVATAMFKTTEFRMSCRWINFPSRTAPSITKNSRNAEKVRRAIFSRDRAKLAGIFRAQPESHYFEQGKYHDCTLAPWADVVRPDQIDLYVKLRDYRADKLDDIRDLYKNSFGSKAGSGAGSSSGPKDPIVPSMAKSEKHKVNPEVYADYGLVNTHVDINTSGPDLPGSLDGRSPEKTGLLPWLLVQELFDEESVLSSGEEDLPQRPLRDHATDIGWLESILAEHDALRNTGLHTDIYQESDSDDMDSFEDDASDAVNQDSLPSHSSTCAAHNSEGVDVSPSDIFQAQTQSKLKSESESKVNSNFRTKVSIKSEVAVDKMERNKQKGSSSRSGTSLLGRLKNKLKSTSTKQKDTTDEPQRIVGARFHLRPSETTAPTYTSSLRYTPVTTHYSNPTTTSAPKMLLN